MQTPNEEYYLYTPLPRTDISRDETKNLRDLGFIPAIQIYFGSQSPSENYLKAELTQEIKSREEVPSYKSVEERTNTQSNNDPKNEIRIETYNNNQTPSTTGPKKQISGTPSWLKLKK